MLHELLFALSGIPGGIFMAKNRHGLEVTKNLPYLHPSEIEILTKLCVLGSHCRRFDLFIEDNGAGRCIDVEGGECKSTTGHYLIAFSDGLCRVLKPYKSILLSLEEKILNDPHITLSHIQNDLEEYFFLFPILSHVIDEIQSKELRGCQILNVLHETAQSGIPIVKSALEKILFVCHGVLFKQISCWMLYGVLSDARQEFFITTAAPATRKDSSAQRKVSAGVEKSSVTGTASDDTASSDRSRAGSTAESEDSNENVVAFADGMILAPDMIPGYFPSRLASKILFIGQSVKTFKNHDVWNASRHKNTDILQGQALAFSKRLNAVRTELDFSVRRLEAEIEPIKVCVTEQLWQMIVVEGKLLLHLKYVKEMFLLDRGELYLAFIDQSQAAIKSARTSSLSYDLNSAFHQCIGKLLTDSDEYESLFSMSMAEKSETGNAEGTNGWRSLLLSYNAPWPLHIVFTPESISRYNALFRFLLSVKRTQLSLQHLWAMQMASKHDASTVMSPTWNLRRQMAFFIDSFQYYLQVDVLDAQFSILCRKIDSTKDFETIQIAHDVYLAALAMHSFLSMKSVYAVLVKLLDVCQLFCDVVSLGQSTEREKRKVEECATEFERRSSLLFKIISSVHTHQSSPHLAQLLLRIDFNKFFTVNTEKTLLAAV